MSFDGGSIYMLVLKYVSGLSLKSFMTHFKYSSIINDYCKEIMSLYWFCQTQLALKFQILLYMGDICGTAFNLFFYVNYYITCTFNIIFNM